jgi:hypothetical protein
MAKMEFEEMRKKLAIIPVAMMLVYVGGEFARNQAVGLESAKCPISGKAANPKISIEVNGKAVGFCCNNCKKSYSKTITDAGPGKCQYSGKASKKSTGLIHETSQLVSFCCKNCAGKYAKANKFAAGKTSSKCPISGKAVNPKCSINVNGAKVGFCCGNCLKTYSKKLAAKADSGKCPISGKAANAATQVVHTKRETKYFCCNNCKGKYAKANFK